VAKVSKGKGNSFLAYQRRFWRRFLGGAGAWARDNIFWDIAVLIIPPIVAAIRNKATSPDWETIKLALWFYGAVFAIYVLVHIVRTPWKVDQDREIDVLNLEGERDNAEAAYDTILACPKFNGHFYQFQIFPRTGLVDPEMVHQARNLSYGRKALDKQDPPKFNYDVFIELYLQNDAQGRGSIVEYVFEIEFDGTWAKLDREFSFKGWILEREEAHMDARNSLRVVKREANKAIPDLSEAASGILEQNKGVEGWLHFVLKDTAYTEFDGAKKHGQRLTLNDGKAGVHVIDRVWGGEPRPWKIVQDMSISA
jgi:hypothetical protein